MNKIKKFYAITRDLRSFFYIISMKIQALVVSCDKFLCACIIEVCHQSIEAVSVFTSALLPMTVMQKTASSK
jgi:hypothetical protein